MINNPKVSVIVVTRNRKEDLRESLKSLHQQTYANVEVVVVDNGSSDGTLEMLKADAAEVQLVELGRNTGAYHARNVGVAATYGEILFFLDDDATLEESSLAKIVDRFSLEENLGVIVCKLIQAGSGVPNAYWFSSVPGASPDVECYLGDMVAEGATAIRRDVFEKVGCWPSHYFRAHVGKDLSYRIIDAGHNIAYLPSATVYHNESPFDDLSRIQIERQKMFYMIRNQLWMVWKYLPLTRAFIESATKISFYFWKSFRTGAFFPFLRGLGAALITMPRILLKERSPVSQRTLAKMDYLTYGELITDPDMLETFTPLSFKTVLIKRFARRFARDMNAPTQRKV